MSVTPYAVFEAHACFRLNPCVYILQYPGWLANVVLVCATVQ